ncbi:MAG TPA: hypothetical protein VFF76_02645 [Holophagaceae bacterium]|jgi:hypothetical protein|nr:hypothetical protein [Holophagaceae bacterium]
MAQAPSFRSRIAATAAALGLLLGIGCSGKSGGNSATSPVAIGAIQGNITYVRIPLLKDANGVPTGLETNSANYLTLPARGIFVRAYELDATNAQWRVKQVTQTDVSGNYYLSVPAGDNYSVQVESFTQPFLGSVSVIADPNGLSSTLPQAQRAHYILRSAPNGTAATSSAPLPAGTVSAGGTYTANFAVDLTTKWMIGSTEVAGDGSSTGFTSAGFEASPTGSRVLAILDSIYAFSVVYGNPSPGAPTDLHYLMGRSEPQGTFIQYNQRAWVQPSGVDLAYDPRFGTDHYFGSIRGAAANDDAWDESVLYVLMGRANTFRQLLAANYAAYPYTLKPVAANIDGLSPDLAMVEGLPYAMAANLLKSPYLADTDGTSGIVSITNVRDTSGVASADIGPYSPRTLAAMTWEIGLKANGITTPGTATTWATINPATIARIFTFTLPTTTQFYPANAYLQLAKLQNAKTAAEPVDLAAIFTDSQISTVATPFNLPWPQPSTTVFGQTWTSTTNGTYAYTGTLSMSADHQVSGVYPNASYKEIAYLGVPQANDQTYNLTLQTTPSALPSGATIQVVVFSGSATQAYTFTGSSAAPITFTLAGNGNTTTPAEYPIRVRLLSPSTLQPDIPFTLQLAPAPPGTLRGPLLGR